MEGEGKTGQGKAACPSKHAGGDVSPGEGRTAMHQILQKANRLHLEPILLFAETRQPGPLAVSSLSLASAHSDIQKVRERR